MNHPFNKFNKSYIYSIRSPHTDLYYIGSTTQTLCRRFANHMTDYKRYLNNKYNYVTSFKIIELGDAYIELLDEINCENKIQLEKYEGEFIRKFKNEIVNRCISGRTKNEYNKDNKADIAIQKKEYYVENKADIAIQRKIYYESHKPTMPTEYYNLLKYCDILMGYTSYKRFRPVDDIIINYM